MKRCQKVVESLLHQGTRGRYYCQLILSGSRIILNEGWGSFRVKFKQWLKLWMAERKKPKMPPGAPPTISGDWHDYEILSRKISDAKRERLESSAPKVPQMISIAEEELLSYARSLQFPGVEKPRVSIVIPVYNNERLTIECLISILRNTKEVSYEIIIVDDSSAERTREVLSQIGNIKYLRNPENIGFLLSCNRAAEHARGTFLLILNNDAQVSQGWLSPLVETFSKYENVGVVGPKVLNPDGRLQAAGGIIWKDGSAHHYGRGDDPNLPEYNYVKEVDYISGACLMIRNDLRKKIGGFDARFSPAYYEDVDLAFEVRQQGYKVVYQPQSIVIHFESVSYGAGSDKGSGRHQIINQKKFTEKWKDILNFQQMSHSHEIFHGRDRSRGKKTILVVDHSVPDFDKYAGSRTSFHYLKIFLELGLNVKFIDDNYIKCGFKYEPYTTLLEQLGIEVLSHDWYRKNWKQWVKNHARSIDYVYLNRPISIDYIDALKRETKAKIIYNCIDFHYLREMREYEIIKDKTLLKLSKEHKKQEFHLFKNSDILFTYSDYEKSILKKQFPKKIVQVIPLFIYDKDFPLGIAKDFETRRGLTFVGGFGHPPNVDGIIWFINEIFPKILKKNNEIELSIIGSNMPEEISKLRSKYINPIGYVSEEKLQEYYSNTRIAIVPLRFGAGVKGKVVEAVAYGVPVVTTEIGREGITGIAGVVRIADQPKEFAESVMDIYMDKQKWTDMRDKQIDYANQHFSLDYCKNLIREILKI
jgi:GT2 family glycosyltransferase